MYYLSCEKEGFAFNSSTSSEESNKTLSETMFFPNCYPSYYDEDKDKIDEDKTDDKEFCSKFKPLHPLPFYSQPSALFPRLEKMKSNPPKELFPEDSYELCNYLNKRPDKGITIQDLVHSSCSSLIQRIPLHSCRREFVLPFEVLLYVLLIFFSV
jgi:hypothetical protein